jgi:2-phospho-L-lactate guanylyltransferase (CobY/MobA/RfbA family)
LLESTFAAAAEVRNADKTAIVTLYPPAIELAEKYQFEVILEEQQISESVSVDFGSREARMRGATSALRLPIDLPLIRTDDIESLLNLGGTSPSTVIVPSRDGTGRTGAACTLVENYRIALDIDEPEDIQELLRVAGESRISDLLHGIGVIDRLKL